MKFKNSIKNLFLILLVLYPTINFAIPSKDNFKSDIKDIKYENLLHLTNPKRNKIIISEKSQGLTYKTKSGKILNWSYKDYQNYQKLYRQVFGYKAYYRNNGWNKEEIKFFTEFYRDGLNIPDVIEVFRGRKYNEYIFIDDNPSAYYFRETNYKTLRDLYKYYIIRDNKKNLFTGDETIEGTINLLDIQD